MWDPQVIVTISEPFYQEVRRSPVWSRVEAVRTGRVYLAPDAPFGWFDRPPSVNRLLGVRWLLHLLYPDRVPGSLSSAVARFYRLFYHVDPSQEQLDALLERAMPR